MAANTWTSDQSWIGSQSHHSRPAMLPRILAVRTGSLDRPALSSARIPMQETTSPPNSGCAFRCERMTLAMGPRFRSDVHWRFAGLGNMPRCSTISMNVFPARATTTGRPNAVASM